MEDDDLRSLFVNFAVIIAQLSVVLSLVLFITGNVSFRKKVENVIRNMCCFWKLQPIETVRASVRSDWSTQHPIGARPNAAGNDIPLERIINLGARVSVSYDNAAYIADAAVDEIVSADNLSNEMVSKSANTKQKSLRETQ